MDFSKLTPELQAKYALFEHRKNKLISRADNSEERVRVLELELAKERRMKKLLKTELNQELNQLNQERVENTKMKEEIVKKDKRIDLLVGEVQKLRNQLKGETVDLLNKSFFAMDSRTTTDEETAGQLVAESGLNGGTHCGDDLNLSRIDEESSDGDY
jgi:phosphate-selective porin